MAVEDEAGGAVGNPPLPHHIAHAPVSPGDQLRYAMGHLANWCVANNAHFTYTEGPARWHMVTSPPKTLPQSADCSAFVTGLAKWISAPDPNGNQFAGGYTGTLLQHCEGITADEARIGDLAVYGPGTGTHAVFVLERLPAGDFKMVSHGEQGDPSHVLHSALMVYFHDSVRFLRFLPA